MKKAEEKEANAEQIVSPETIIPFEDFEKPERSSGDPVSEKASTESKESRRAESEFNPMEEEHDTVTAGLNTLPDLEPVPEAELPVETEPQETEAAAAGDIKMQPVEQETGIETAGTEESVAPAEMEASVPETPQEEMVAKTPQPETAPTETTEAESTETESERIARIVKEEIAKAENEPAVEASPESAPEPEESLPQEEALEVAGMEPQK